MRIEGGYDMMYIFISGYDHEYRTNIYRTLTSPVGTVNSYTFKSSGLAAVNNKLDEAVEERKSIDVIIIFVDRYGGSNGDTYQYYPIRMATYCSREDNSGNNRVTFYVKLGNYVFPRNWKNVQEDICRLGDIPQKSHEANTKADGQYVSVQDANIIRQEEYYTGDAGWLAAVKELRTKRAFLATANRELDHIAAGELAQAVPFFYRLEYRGKNKVGYKYHTIRPVVSKADATGKTQSFFRFSEKGQYQIEIHFYFPHWEADTNTNISLQISRGLTIGANPSVLISYSDVTGENQGVKTVPLDIPQADGELYFNAKAENLASGKTLVNFTQNTPHQRRNSYKKWAIPVVLLAIVAIAFVNLMIGYKELPEDEQVSFWSYFLEHGNQLLEKILNFFTKVP